MKRQPHTPVSDRLPSTEITMPSIERCGHNVSYNLWARSMEGTILIDRER
jgi:hypothetical protein